MMKNCWCVQCVQISDPWLMHEVLAVANKHPEVIDKPRGFPLPIYDCFDRVIMMHLSLMIVITA